MTETRIDREGLKILDDLISRLNMDAQVQDMGADALISRKSELASFFSGQNCMSCVCYAPKTLVKGAYPK
jgi:hypothetical protein